MTGHTQSVSDVIVRIKHVIESNHLSQAEFAKAIGINACNLSKLLNGKIPVSDNVINKIVVNFHVSKKWLMGVENESSTLVPGNLRRTTVNGVHVGDDMLMVGTPVYDIDATAGHIGRDMAFASDLIIGSIDMPSIPLDASIVRVSGDSMCPELNDGDFVALRQVAVDDVIFWGQIYMVELDDYRMVKYVRRHADADKLILRSENPKYDDIEVSRSAVRALFLVTNIISVTSRL